MSNKKSYRKIIIPQIILEAMLVAKEVNPLDEVSFLKAISIVHEVISKNEIYNRDKDYHILNIPLHSTYLKNRYGNIYKEIKTWLITNQILYVDNSYKGKCNYFHISSPLFYNELIIRIIHFNKSINIDNIISSYCFRSEIKNNTLGAVEEVVTGVLKNRIFTHWIVLNIPLTTKDIKFLSKTYEDDSVAINNAPHHIKKMGGHYRKNLEIDFDGAKSFIDKQLSDSVNTDSTEEEMMEAQRKYASRLSSISSIHNGKKSKSLRFSRNSTNYRIDTNLTNMASELRRFIIGASDMTYFDLKNSQPVLFNVLLKDSIGISDEFDAEIETFKSLTLGGIWYERLMIIFDCSRDDAKEIWMLIAYSKNSDCKHLKNKFKKVFPNINQVIDSFKKVNHSQFAIELQIAESRIFIDEICRGLVGKDIIPITLHDGLLVNNEDADETYNYMKLVLSSHLGSAPSISIEELGKPARELNK